MALVGGPGADTLTGGAGDDVISGLGGNDRLDGGAGSDIIDGGDGADVIKGGDGDDTVTGGAGNDTLVGGAGLDTAVYATALPPATPVGTWNGALLTIATGAEGTDVLNQFERLRFNGVDYAISGRNVVAALNDDIYHGLEDQAAPISGNVLANDSDVDSVLHVDYVRSAARPNQAGITMPVTGAYGFLTMQTDGSYVYTPYGGYNGADDVFYYYVTDGGVTRQVTLTISLAPVNDAPQPLLSNVVTNVGEPVSGAVGAYDPDGDAVTYTMISGPAHGSLVFHSDGSFVYTPDAGYTGGDGFIFQASDGQASSQAEEGIDVRNPRPPNQAPVASNATGQALEDHSISGLVHASDGNGDALTYQLAAGPAHGSVTLQANGHYTYTPDADFSGSDSFSFRASDGQALSNLGTVSLTLDPVNDAPVAYALSVSTDEDTAVSGLFSGSDAEGAPLTYFPYDQPQHGYVSRSEDGSGFIYTPYANFHGTDSFTYRAYDGTGADGGVSAPVTVTVTVRSVLDPPFAAPDWDWSMFASFIGSYRFTPPGGSVEGDPVQFVIVQRPTHGALFNNNDGTFSYRPDHAYDGPDEFTFLVTNGAQESGIGHVGVTVHHLDGPATPSEGWFAGEAGAAITGAANAVDPEHDHLTYALAGDGPAHGTLTLNPDGSFSYTPEPGFVGRDSFQFTADDGTGYLLAPATIHLAVGIEDQAPVMPAASFSGLEDETIQAQLSATDADGDALTYILVSGPSHGVMDDFRSDGLFIYHPDADYHGADSITVLASDGTRQSEIVTLSLSIASVNDAPVIAPPLDRATNEDAAISGRAYAEDYDDDTMTFQLVGGGLEGLTFNPDGHWAYDPRGVAALQALTPGQQAQVSFSYRVSDGTAWSDPVTVHIQVDGRDEVFTGTAGRDILSGTGGDDSIFGLAGADDLRGLGGVDHIDGGEGADKLFGGDGDDSLLGGAGNDGLNGEAGADTLDGGEGDDTLDGGDGNDELQGGIGADIVKGGAGDDTVRGGEGADNVQGGVGNDIIVGGQGVDSLSGGTGADRFVFGAGDLGASAGATDRITDFKAAQGDILDLAAIDADTTQAGDQAFTLVGAFSHQAGEMTLSYASAGNTTTLAMDTDGDGAADYLLLITGNVASAGGWVL